MMTAHAIYDKSKNMELITTFNHIGVFFSYRQKHKVHTGSIWKRFYPHT